MKLFSSLAIEAQQCLDLIGTHRRSLVKGLVVLLCCALVVDLVWGYAGPYVALLWISGILALLFIESLRFHRQFPVIFAATLSLAVPGCFGFSLALNMANLPGDVAMPIYWPLVYCLVLICYVQISNAGMFTMFSWLVLYLLGLVVYLIPSANFEALWNGYVLVAGAYITVALIGVATDRNKVITLLQATQRFNRFSDYVAHELRTPLMGMSTRLGGIAHLVYELDHPPISEKHLVDQAAGSVADLQFQLGQANELINLHLFKLETAPVRDTELAWVDLDKFIGSCIDALPFGAPNAKPKVQLEGVTGVEALIPEMMMRYVIYQIVKNAFENNPDGLIRVVLEHNPVAVVCESVGPPVPLAVMERFSQSNQRVKNLRMDSGSGLEFCRRVVNFSSGDFYLEASDGSGCRAVVKLKNTRIVGSNHG